MFRVNSLQPFYFVVVWSRTNGQKQPQTSFFWEGISQQHKAGIPEDIL